VSDERAIQRSAERTFPLAFWRPIWWAVAVSTEEGRGPKAPVLDVHTHFFPAGLRDYAEVTGDARWPSLTTSSDGSGRIMRGSDVFRPVTDTSWDLHRRAEAMDALGIERHVLSPVPVMLTSWAEGSIAAEYAREHNEAFASAVSAGPAGRFEWMGSVPLQDVDLAMKELEHGVTQLGMVGVEIGTEVGGRELDDPMFASFWSAVEELDVAIFIHPTDGAGAIRRSGMPYEFGLGMLTDTATAVTSLVFGGVLESHPRLRVGVSHGCGTFPWSYPRLLRGASLRPASEAIDVLSAHTDSLVRRLWADTLVFDPAHVALLIERFGSDHLMVGSDFPFYPPSFGHPLEAIYGAAAAGTCTNEEVARMRGANAERFLGLNRNGVCL
jgi:aminocarboxymuconate-semialdehyde decarboxylase